MPRESSTSSKPRGKQPEKKARRISFAKFGVTEEAAELGAGEITEPESEADLRLGVSLLRSPQDRGSTVS